MKPAEWITFLSRVPSDGQGGMILGTHAGTEISVHSLLKIEESHVLVRGRLGGTTEGGMLFVLPYESIAFCVFTRPLEEAAQRELFGELPRPAEARSAETVTEPPATDAGSSPAESVEAEQKPRPGLSALRLQLRSKAGLGPRGGAPNRHGSA